MIHGCHACNYYVDPALGLLCSNYWWHFDHHMSYGGLYLIVAVPLLVVASVLALDSVVCVGGVSEDLKV